MPRKSLKREDICLNQFVMQIKVPNSGEKNHKGYLLVRKENKHQDLSQEWIGSPYCFVQMCSGLSSKLSLPIKLLTSKI